MSSPSSGSGKPPSLQELRAARAARPSFLRRKRRWFFAIGGLLVLLIVFGFLGLPPIVKAQAIKRLSERLGREVTIENLRINPLTLSATIEGFAIAEAAPSAGEFTGWRRLHVNFDSWSLLKGEVGFQEISLDGFHARVAKAADQSLNFADIVARLTAPGAEVSATEAQPAESKPPVLAVGLLSVTEARLDFADASRERPFATAFGPVTFSLRDFRSVGDRDSPYHFEAVTAAGERFAWTGSVAADPVTSEGELSLSNIDLARLSPYYHHFVEGELRSARVDFSGRYRLELRDAVPALTLTDGSFTLRDVRFGAPGVEADAFALRRLAVTGIAADSTTRRAAIEKLTVEGIDLKAVRDAEGIDLLRLVRPRGEAEPQAAAAAPGASALGGPSPVVTLGEFSLRGVRAELLDLTTPRRAEHRIENLVLSVRDLDSSDLAKTLPLSLQLTLPAAGRLELEGGVAAQPLAADLALVVEDVSLANASPYVEPFLNIRLVGGTVRARGRAALRDGAVSFAGDLGAAGFRTVDGKLAQDFVTWTDFALRGVRATSQPLTFHADEIGLVEPSAALRIEPDGSLSIAQTVAAPASAPVPGAAPAAPSAPPLAPVVSVGRVELSRAALRFEDRSITPAARGSLVDFGGTISGLSSEALGRADVDLSGKVDGAAPVSIKGKLNPLGTPAFVDLKVDFKGIDLQPGAGPYVGKFVGRELARGNLNVVVAARLQDRKVESNNVVTLDQFFLGEKTDSPDATKLPVNLALALLRDSAGRIVIDLPVKGSLDDPEFKIGRVVVRVVVNILTKAATSPFSLLGAAFGGGGDELGWQEFAPGASALDPAGIHKLETLAKALGARPALSLDLAGVFDPVADLDALRRERLERQVRVTAWEARRAVDPNTPSPEALEITPELRVGMLARLYAEAFPPAPGEAAPRVVLGEGQRTIPLVPATSPSAGVPAPGAQPALSDRRPQAHWPRFGVSSTSRQARAPIAAEAVAPPPVSAGETVPPAEGEPGAPTLSLAEMESRLAERIEVPESELLALGEARARVIRTWLIETGKIAPDRIFLAPVGGEGRRVTLQLK